jgi:hypothetical protein
MPMNADPEIIHGKFAGGVANRAPHLLHQPHENIWRDLRSSAFIRG